MRCYHLGNTYLPGIHAGIQSAHSQHELAVKYLLTADCHAAQAEMYKEWLLNHKTMIVLNGGWQSSLQEWVKLLESQDHPYAWTTFHEELDSLNGALTNVAIVLPYHIYGVGRELRDVTKPGVATVVQVSSGDMLEWRGGMAALVSGETGHTLHSYSPFEVDLAIRLSRPSLM